MSALDPDWSVPESPPFAKLLLPKYLFSMTAFFLLFRWGSRLVKTHLWKDHNGFKQYRLRNLTVCLTHSCITGCWVFTFAITHLNVMFTDPVFYYKPYMKFIVILTIGYFFHDAYDMVQYELSQWTIELLLHHFSTGFVMSVAVCGETFTVYAYWSLLMEVNSIFLHIRTLFQLSGAAETYPTVFKGVKFMNLFTFVIFRYAVQLWQLYFVIVWRAHFHFFYFACGFFGGMLFLIINTLLFLRLLASDGYLCNSVKQYIATNRDEQKLIKET